MSFVVYSSGEAMDRIARWIFDTLAEEEGKASVSLFRDEEHQRWQIIAHTNDPLKIGRFKRIFIKNLPGLDAAYADFMGFDGTQSGPGPKIVRPQWLKDDLATDRRCFDEPPAPFPTDCRDSDLVVLVKSGVISI